MTTAKKRPSQDERRLAFRGQLWPDSPTVVWNRKTEHGFCTIPRILLLVMTLIKQLSNKQGELPRVLWTPG